MTRGPTVMVIDDDVELRESVCEFLEDDGYHVVSASDGATALVRLRGNIDKPALILLDLMMPGMNGWEFREAQLRDSQLAAIPVVVMTASRDVGDIAASEIVHKPLKLNRLLEVVGRHTAVSNPQEATWTKARSDASKPSNDHAETEAARVPVGSSESRASDGEDLHTRTRAFDWSKTPVRAGVNEVLAGGDEMGARMRAFDWSRSPVGDVATWPQSLRAAMSICLGSRFPICIYWGPSLATLYNDGWSTIPGTKHPAALGRPAREVWPEIWDTISGWFDRVVGTGESIYQEGQFLAMHRHGYTEECYFDFTFSPIRGESGRVEGVFNAVIETTFRFVNERRTRVLRDLSEAMAPARTAADACLHAAESLGQAAHDVPFCVLFLVDDGAPVARLAAIAGLSADSTAAPSTIALDDDSIWPLRKAASSKNVEVVRSLKDHFNTEFPSGAWPEPADCALVAPVLSVGKARGFLVLGVNPRRAIDDDYLLFAERAASHIASAIATATDYEKEKRRAEALAEIDRAKTTFFSNVSHEFRTPLTLMLGPARDLLTGAHGEVAENQRQQLEVLHRNGLRLQKLVNALLDFSRLEAGRVQASYEPIDLSAATRELASAFDSAISNAGLTFRVELVRLDEAVYVDRDMWEKIVLNLLSNALKFTFEGGIELSLRVENGSAVLRVKDSGVGIPGEELPRLFDRFHRVEGARSRTHEGSGIGLASVQELAKLHGGKVDVESEAGVGSTFSVSIPLGAAHLPKERINVAPSERTTAGAAPFVEEARRWTLGSMQQDENARVAGRILLADDNVDMRDYVRRHLERHWVVESVEDGTKAFASAVRNPPDLVLTDVMMPGLDGFELLRRLRTDERTRSIPVIMLSARSGEEARIEGLHAGAEDYLTKPFSAGELLARVSTHLELARHRKEQEKQRQHFYRLLMQAPVPVSVMMGPSQIYQLVNETYREMVAGREVIGKTMREAYPELPRDAAAFSLIEGVYCTGKTAFVDELRVLFDRRNTGTLEEAYFRTTTQALRDEGGGIVGVITVSVDITTQVFARRSVEESEKKFRRLITQVQAGVAQTDLTGRFTLANERYQQIVGRSEAELRELRIQDITHPDDLTATEEQFQKLTAKGTAFFNEERCLQTNGSVVWVQNCFSRIDDGEGTPQGIAAITMDITQQKLAEHVLRESEQRFRNMADSAPVMVWVTEPDARCTYLSKSWYDFTGQTPETGLGFGWLDVVHPDDKESSGKIFTAANAKHEPFALEYRLRRQDGVYRWAIDSASPRKGPNGEFLGYIGSVIDITEQIHARETRLAEAERAVRFSEMFVGILGHDLRNPLSAITIAASLLEAPVNAEKSARLVSRIVVSADRMDRMIDQLLDFTRIRVGQGLPLNPTENDLSKIARSIIDELEPVHRREIRFEKAGDVTGTWDSDRLSQLLSNLTANACQHGSSGAPVVIRLDGSHPDVVKIVVANGGVVPSELLPVIFEPLRSGGQARREGSSGLGLGLYISQQITNAHGGTIRVDSSDEHGTRFFVELPRRADPNHSMATGLDPVTVET